MAVSNDATALSERRTSPARRRALFAGIACWIVFALMALGVANGATVAFDHAGLLLPRGDDLTSLGPPWFTDAVRAITDLGGWQVRNVLALAGVIALAIASQGRQAAALFLTVASGWLANSWLKLQFGRERPDLVPHLVDAAGLSFPSGHSFNSAVVYLSLALALAPLASRRNSGTALIICAVFLSITIAATRVWLGVHYPSDAVAGWCAGAGWALLAYALLWPAPDRVGSRLPDPDR